MKRLFILLVFAMSWLLSQQTITITGEGCNFRKNPIPMVDAVIIGQANAGEVYNVLETYQDYVFAEVIAGEDKKSTSDNVGHKGYIWARRISSHFPGKAQIIGEAVCVRSAPKKADDNLICKIKVNSTINIIEQCITWYKTEKGWVYAKLVQVN